jgi:tellurium resistance protein TerD
MSTVSLQKDTKVEITKSNPGLTKVHVGLGWDTSAVAGAEFDLDVFAYIYKNGTFSKSTEDVLFYNNRDVFPGLELSPDNKTGVGDGHDEWIKVNFAALSPDVTAIVIGVSIYDAVVRKQNFGMVKNSFIEIAPESDIKNALVRYDLQEDHGTNTLLILGKLYKHTDGEWKFEAMGDSMEGNFAEVAAIY